MIFIAGGIIALIVLFKYKPMYKVSIAGREIGYLQSNENTEEFVKNVLNDDTDKNIDDIQFNEMPKYELVLVDTSIQISDEEIVKELAQNATITYKYYEVAIDDETIEKAKNQEDAEDIINSVKENAEEELNLTISEKYTENQDEVNINEIEVAKVNSIEKAQNYIEEVEEQKEEEERINSMPDVNGIKLATKPVSGTISSRYGVSSSIRKSTHTGLDIATSTGTPIYAVAEGTVINASYQGAYGNLVKIDHGNGVETWYGHASKMYVSVGEKIAAGEVIAAVGSTGNSTGPHLHFEIRINGEHVDPQNYLYK